MSLEDSAVQAATGSTTDASGVPGPADGAPGAPVLRRADARAGLRAFMQVPAEVYRDDPAWVAPLWLERRLHYSRQNPFLHHGRWQGWVAMRDGRPVGRISAQIDTLHQARYGATGHFGLLEAADDPQVFHALVEAAEQWLAAQGVREVTGPFSFSINQECGLLVDGFETPPAVMMPHGRRWYAPRLEAEGYRPAQDLIAYGIDTGFRHPPAMTALLGRFGERLRLRSLRRRELGRELELLRGIFNDAWSRNWGFVPFTAEEFAELGQVLRWVVDDDLVRIAEVDGEAAAFIVGLPDLNELIADLDGRLLPFGWLRLIRRLRGGAATRGRVPLMGVRRCYQDSPLGAALAFAVISGAQSAYLERGIRWAELSWILDDNAGMRKILERLGGEPYKRYRLYRKAIA